MGFNGSGAAAGAGTGAAIGSVIPGIGTAIGALGGGLLGGLFGGGGSSNTNNDFLNYLMALQAQQSQTLFNQDQKIRKGFAPIFSDVLSGTYDPTTSPTFAPSFALGKKGIEGQYDVAKENILSMMPRGGTQLGALGDLEASRAEQESSLPQQISMGIVNDLLNKAYGSVYPTVSSGTGLAMSSLGNLTGLLQNQNLQNQALDAQQNSSTMGGLGSLLALLAMKK